MVAAASPYVAWMSVTAGQAELTAAQVRVAAAAYETAYGLTVPPPVIAENRAELMILIATNLLGQNTPAIAVNEAEYGEMWAQDAAAMFGYAATAATATEALLPFEDAPLITNPGGLLEQAVIQRQFRRLGTHVARWPAPILVASGVFVLIMMIALPRVPIGWDEAAATPSAAESNRGYRAADRHFAPNQLLPTQVMIETDHDIRNPAGLTAIERITAAIMAIGGVRMVQSATYSANFGDSAHMWRAGRRRYW